MPTGEWGYFNVSLKDRYLRVKREEYTRSEFLSLFRKPNGYRTLTGMELLKEYSSNLFNHRINRAIYWIKQNLSSGWFLEWDAFVSGRFPDRSDTLPHVEKAPDVRHTAQALLGLLKYDKHPGPELSKGLYNILNHQLESGMWPRKPDFNHVEIFRSVCCADLLFHALDNKFKKKLSRLSLNKEFFPRARIALDKTCAWLVDCAERHGSLWEDEYQTAMVLERIGNRLLSDRRYKNVVKLIIKTLLERMTKEGWTNSSIIKPEIRYSDVSKYETTVRVCASLLSIKKEKIFLPMEELKPVLAYLREQFQPKIIDASDYRYYLKIFYPDSKEFTKIIQKVAFFDYLNKKQSNIFKQYSGKNHLIRVMSIWIIDCLERLEQLAEGKALGLPNYDQAFLEKEEELLTILDTMRSISVKQPIEQLPSSLFQYFQTGNLQYFIEELDRFCKKYELPISKRLSLSDKIYQEVRETFSDIVAKYLSLMSKP